MSSKIWLRRDGMNKIETDNCPASSLKLLSCSPEIATARSAHSLRPSGKNVQLFELCNSVGTVVPRYRKCTGDILRGIHLFKVASNCPMWEVNSSHEFRADADFHGVAPVGCRWYLGLPLCRMNIWDRTGRLKEGRTGSAHSGIASDGISLVADSDVPIFNRSDADLSRNLRWQV